MAHSDQSPLGSVTACEGRKLGAASEGLQKAAVDIAFTPERIGSPSSTAQPSMVVTCLNSYNVADQVHSVEYAKAGSQPCQLAAGAASSAEL